MVVLRWFGVARHCRLGPDARRCQRFGLVVWAGTPPENRGARAGSVTPYLSGRLAAPDCGLSRRSCQAVARGRCSGTASAADVLPEAFETGAAALEWYAHRRSAALPVNVLTELLQRTVALGASSYDERLSGLVEHVVSQRNQLSLTALVDVSRTLEALEREAELALLTGMVVENASFLPSHTLTSFARTLAIASRSSRRTSGRDTQGRAAVFRILGEHITESMFEASLSDLADALLAIACYYCSRGGPDLALAQPWHHDIFASSAVSFAARAHDASDLCPAPLVKVLRAYKLYLLASPRLVGSKERTLTSASAEDMPAELASLLLPRLGELTLRDTSRIVCSYVTLYRRGFCLDSVGAELCGAAALILGQRAGELSLSDILHTLQALATLTRDEKTAGIVAGETVVALFNEIPRHVPALGQHEALMLLRAASSFPNPMSVVAVELASAELQRDWRSLRPPELSGAAAALVELRSNDAGLWHELQQAFTSRVEIFQPGPLALSLRSFAKARRLEHATCKAARAKIVRDLPGFQPRDIALSVWSFARLSHYNKPFLAAVQEHLKHQRIEEFRPSDVAMLLWSFARFDAGLDPDVLSGFVRFVALRCQSDFDAEASIVTSLAFAKLGFAQQTVLVDLYRGLYAHLPMLSNSQLVFVFFLFSTSGIRDDALVARFLYETKNRVNGLRGQDLANVVLACSRVVTPEACAEKMGLRDGLRAQLRRQLGQLAAMPLLSVYLAAPALLSLPREDTLGLADALSPKLSVMKPPELARALVATARAQLVHKPLLLPLFMAIHHARDELAGPEVVGCIWSVYSLGFCKPKLQRSLSYRLFQLARQRDIPPRSLRDILPALRHFGYWERLPVGLRRAVWRLSSEELRVGLAAPPPTEQRAERGDLPWRLPAIEKGRFQRILRQHRLTRLSQAVGLEALPGSDDEDKDEESEQRQLQALQGPASGRSAVDDFVSMVRQL